MKFAQAYKRMQSQMANPMSVLYTWVPYKELKKQIKVLDKETCSRRRSEVEEDMCPVCMEDFGCASNMVVTNCGHKVHAFCLVDTVTTAHQSCPLCRCPLKELIPSGFDGHALRFAAQLRMSMDAVQTSHDDLFRDLEDRRQELLHGWGGQTTSLIRMRVSCEMRPGAAKRKMLLDTAMQLLEELAAALEYERLACEAIRKIAKKFDKISGSSLSKEVLRRLWKQKFFLDSSKDGNGRVQRLYESLAEFTAELEAGNKEETKTRNNSLIHRVATALHLVRWSREQVVESESADEDHGILCAPEAGLQLLSPVPVDMWKQVQLEES
jgi:hypothetical protein